MRVLVAALLLACVVLLALVVVGLLSGDRQVARRARQRARWVASNTGADGQTHVEVALVTRRGQVLETRQVTTIGDLDDDYEARLLEAMAQARSRADVLNLESRELH